MAVTKKHANNSRDDNLHLHIDIDPYICNHSRDFLKDIRIDVYIYVCTNVSISQL